MTEHDAPADAPASVTTLRTRLEEGLESLDPHHRLRGRPVSFHVIAGRTLEIVYRDVTRIEESEVLGVKRLLRTHCYCIVEPQTAETLTVRFVVPLDVRE
jgi:hypothetical protein